MIFIFNTDSTTYMWHASAWDTEGNGWLTGEYK
jgi:hypothetical protein